MLPPTTLLNPPFNPNSPMPSPSDSRTNLILPIGTQVVSRVPIHNPDGSLALNDLLIRLRMKYPT